MSQSESKENLIKVRREEDRFTTVELRSGFVPKVVFRPEDAAGVDYERDLGDPGQYPYTRGIYPEMYRKFLWLISFTTCEETAEATNLKWKKQIAQGGTGVRQLTDVPSDLGVDPDHPLAKYDVASNGTPTWALCELETVLDGVDITNIDIESANDAMWMTLGLYTMLIAVFEKRGIPLSKMRLSLINDPVAAVGFHGFQGVEIPVGRRINTDIVEFSVKNTPLVHPFVPCGYDMGEQGITPVQQVAIILANAIQYSTWAVERGVNFDDFAPRIAFSVHCGISLFETVCKVRALRRMWARIAKERFKAQNPKSMGMRCGLRCGACNLTDQQLVNNIPRVTIEILAGILCGAQAIDTIGYDDPVGIPCMEARTVGIATHNILAHEAMAGLTADPLGGSYYVEWLTNQIEAEAQKALDEIEEMGGSAKAVEAGWIEKWWAQSAIKFQQEVEEGKRLMVGINRLVIPKEEEIPMPVHRYSLSNARDIALKKFKRFKETRDQNAAREALLKLREAARSGRNIVRPTVEAYKAGATLGEVTGMVREGLGYDYDFFSTKVPRPQFLD